MQSTGNAGGNHNLLVTPTMRGDTAALARQMGRGLVVTELMGQGVNQLLATIRAVPPASGSRRRDRLSGVEITIAGNLLDLYQRIVAIGDDIDRRGSKLVGSLLIESMQIAGT